MQLKYDVQTKVDAASDGFRLSIENVLQLGFNLFRKSPVVFIAYGIIGAIALSNPISGLIFGGPIIVGYYTIAQMVNNNRNIEFSDFFKSFDRFVPLLLLNLLISVVVILGLILLIIPGIYFAVSYLFAHFFVWFYHVDPSEAVQLSRKTVSGNFGQIFLLCLILGGINFLGILTFGVGLLVTLPFSYCVVYAAFDDIIGIPK